MKPKTTSLRPLRLEFGRIATEEWARCGELVTSRPGAAVTIDPAAIIASNETASATLHIADSGTVTDQTAGVRTAAACFEFGIWKCRNGGDEGQDTDEDGTHDAKKWLAM
jgi:hypothetical protein